MSYVKKFLLVTLICLFALLIFPNARALYEGILYYVRPMLFPDSFKPVNRAGRYAALHDLVSLDNAARLEYLRRHLASRDITVEEIAIPDSPFPNLFIRPKTTAPLTIYSAHYDKLYDDANYHGASDNTAALAVLLAAMDELASSFDSAQERARAFLFTGEEETGLRGARAFVEYARRNHIAIRAIINFDNLGRGKLAARPSAEKPGFIFWLPFVGDLAYDGRGLHASPAYPRVPAALAQSLTRAQPDLVILEQFTARSDSNIFQADGIPTVAISGDDIFFLDQTWHTYADRVELIDERNLDLAFDLITR